GRRARLGRPARADGARRGARDTGRSAGVASQPRRVSGSDSQHFRSEEDHVAKQAFVTGGTGFTGGALCKRLIERGDGVTALVRSKEKARGLAALGVRLVEGDLRDKSSFGEAMAGHDVVYH